MDKIKNVNYKKIKNNTFHSDIKGNCFGYCGHKCNK